MQSGSFSRLLRAAAPWLVYAAAAVACTYYLNERARLVPKWGEWYMASEGQPYVLMQVRSFLHGRLALLPHPAGAGNDYLWGRGGMHDNWGLGLPLLATPFHVIGRLFGAPGFPDDVRFLVFYAATLVVLARALHKVSRPEPTALVASAAAAGFMLVYPTFVGLVTARFLIYEQTIATGALFGLVLLAGLLALLHRSTGPRLVAVCAAAGFATWIRIPLAVYGVTTLALGLVVAHRKGASRRVLLAGLLAFVGVTALYLVGNVLRFGAPFVTGYENCIAGSFPNRGTRWGTPFLKVPLLTAAKEMFATLFLLEPVSQQIMMGTPPESVRAYAVGERWREYYSPTYDLSVFALWSAALVIVVWRVLRHRLWRRDRPLEGEVLTLVGAWALVPSVTLFFFYSRVVTVITRYAVDLYPAMAAACLCAGMAIVAAVRKRAPGQVPSAQLLLAGVVALDIAGWRGWASGLSRPIDGEAVKTVLASIDARASEVRVGPESVACGARPAPVMHTDLGDWWPDCSFVSGMVMALRHNPCLTFELASRGPWSASDDQALAGFRVHADFDALQRCGPAAAEGNIRRLTMCEPRPPPFLLDGMRLYSLASLDADLQPIDRLRLLRVDPAPRCP